MKGKPKIIKAAFFSAALGSYVYFLFMSDRINAAVSFATNARNDRSEERRVGKEG